MLLSWKRDGAAQTAVTHVDLTIELVQYHLQLVHFLLWLDFLTTIIELVEIGVGRLSSLKSHRNMEFCMVAQSSTLPSVVMQIAASAFRHSLCHTDGVIA